MSSRKQKIAMLLAAMVTLSTLTGCSSNDNAVATTPNEPIPTVTVVPVFANQAQLSESAGENSKPAASSFEVSDWANDLGLTEQQRNSFSMLYHLAITAEEIRISRSNRLMLDDIYTSLLNDINPGAVDETTQDHLRNLRDIIKSYLDISVKRDRLQYIYNQDKAATIRSAVPNPLAVLSMTNSLDWKKLAASVVYTVVDSYSNYKSANASVDREFLLSGWELDDEETSAVQKNRDRAFDYMVDIVQEYGLDGKLTLSEDAINTFAEICAIDVVQQKIRRLESEEETYKLLGNYWLELADCYFETSQYQKCLDCVYRYNALSTGIYRKDFNYVQILPKAVVAAQMTYSGDEYITVLSGFTNAIIENTTTKDWSSRYFASQVYLDLYQRTGDREYLELAYNIAYDNVAILVDEQRKLNDVFIAPVQEVTIEEPDYKYMSEEEEKTAKQEYKEELKRLKEYNKSLKKARETELPALYEPFVLNCDLLFALAEEMGITEAEKAEIEAILQTEINGVFLVKPINDRYSFSQSANTYAIDFSKDRLLIPVHLMSTEAQVIVTVSENGETQTFDDFTVTKVDRKDGEFDTFVAHMSSKLMSDHTWMADSKVTVSIVSSNGTDPLVFNYKVSEYKENFWVIPDKVVFEAE